MFNNWLENNLLHKYSTKHWISNYGDIKLIKDLDDNHLNNINKKFKILFIRLLKVKIEIFKRNT